MKTIRRLKRIATFSLLIGAVCASIGCGTTMTTSTDDLPCGKYKNGKTVYKGKDGKCYYKDDSGTKFTVECNC